MSPAQFGKLAKQIAGPRWKTRLGPMIGRSRWMVWAYARGSCDITETVEKLMQLLAKDQVNAE